MAITVFSPAVRPSRLQAVRDWLRQAGVALTLPAQDSEHLSNRHLIDIGAEKPDITRAVDQEVGRLGLLDIGWQQPRRPNRR